VNGQYPLHQIDRLLGGNANIGPAVTPYVWGNNVLVEAIHAADVRRPDVVLLDIGLPKVNEYDAAREIRKHTGNRALTIIAVTGWGQDEDKRRSAEAGIELHLTKRVNATIVSHA